MGTKYILTEHYVEACIQDRCHQTVGIMRRNIHSGDTWVIYDVSNLVLKHLQCNANKDSPTLSLAIRFTSYNLQELDKPVLVSHVGNFNRRILKYFGTKAPWLLRTKRSSVSKVFNVHAPCHLQFWYVDFQKLKWDEWILQPSGYFANVCLGHCAHPLSDQVNVTNHAYVKSVYRSMNGNAVSHLPLAYCVPIRLKPLRLLYMSNNSLVLRTMQELVATGCGCM